MCQQRIDLSGDAGQRGQLRIDGHDHSIIGDPALALGGETIELYAGQIEAFGGKVIIDARLIEIAVNDQIGAQVGGGEVLAEYIRLEQAGVQFKLAEMVFAEIDRAISIDAHRVGIEGQHIIKHAVLHLRGQVDRHRRLEKHSRVAAQDQVRVRGAGDMEGAALRVDVQVQQVVRAEIGDGAAVPLLPCALAADIGGEGLVETEQFGRNAIGRGVEIGADIELVPVRRGIDQHLGMITFFTDRTGIDLQTLVQQVGLTIDGDDVGFTHHRRVEHQGVDLQAIDVDIEVRQQRAVIFRRVAGIEHRRTQDFDLRCRKIADIDVLVEIAEGPPIEVNGRALDEDAFEVLDLDVMQGHLTIERTIDLADLDL